MHSGDGIRHFDGISENEVLEDEPRTVPCDLCGRETPVPDRPFHGHYPNVVSARRAPTNWPSGAAHLVAGSCDTGAPVDPLYRTCLMCHLRALDKPRAPDYASGSDNFDKAKITVACRGFDSTGSKLTAAVTEVQQMAEVRLADQYVFGIVDGLGWNARQGDFPRTFALYATRRIDGLYTLADLDLDQFEVDLTRAAQPVGLLP